MKEITWDGESLMLDGYPCMYLEKSSKGFYFGIDDYYHSVFSKDELLSIAECLTKVANSCEEEDV